MHTRRGSGRDVNRGEQTSSPPRRLAHRPLPTHAQHFAHPRAQPPKGWRGPCPPLCSAAGTAARRAPASMGSVGRAPRSRARTRTDTRGGVKGRGGKRRGGGFTCNVAALHYAAPHTHRPPQRIHWLPAVWVGFFFGGWVGGWGSSPDTPPVTGLLAMQAFI